MPSVPILMRVRRNLQHPLLGFSRKEHPGRWQERPHGWAVLRGSGAGAAGAREGTLNEVCLKVVPLAHIKKCLCACVCVCELVQIGGNGAPSGARQPPDFFLSAQMPIAAQSAVSKQVSCNFTLVVNLFRSILVPVFVDIRHWQVRK